MCITISLFYPSCVEKGRFPLRATEDEMRWDVVFKWPATLLEFKIMQKKLAHPAVRYEEYHLEFVDFLEAMKMFRLRRFDWIEYKAKINLLFSVQTFINDNFNLAWCDDST